MEDWLKKWYKEGFEKSKASSPKKNWKKIAAELDEWPAHWYKSNADKVGIRPKHTNWDAIKKELSDLPVLRKNPIFQIRAIVVTAIAFLLPFLLINPVFYVSNAELSNLTEENSEIQIELNKVSSQESLAFNEQNSTNKNDDSKTNRATTIKKEKLSNLISEETELNEGLLSITNSKDLIETLDKEPETNINQITVVVSQVEKVDDNQEEKSPLIVTNEQPDEKEFDQINKLPIKKLDPIKTKSSFNSGLNDIKNPLIYNGWYIGGGAVLQKTTLLNPINSRSLVKGSGVMSSPNLNVSINLNVMKQLKNRNAFSAFVMLNNNKSQRYTETNFDEVAEGQISLDYVLVGANYHSRLLESYDNTLSLNSVMGLYSAINTGISEHKNTEQIDFLKGGFRNYDVGVSFGFETNFYLNSKWMIYSDLIYQLGVINIFNGTDKVPADFFHTQTSSLNLGVGIRRKL